MENKLAIKEHKHDNLQINQLYRQVSLLPLIISGKPIIKQIVIQQVIFSHRKSFMI